MKDHLKAFCLLLCAAMSAVAAADVGEAASQKRPAKTKIMFLFDTEDYTCDRSNDAIRDIADMLKSEGVRGNFNIVGFLATRILELGRQDVVEALKYHVIGSQTLYHTRHPDIAEIGDDPDYERAYRRTLAEEARALGMLDAAFGENRCCFWCPPGNSISLVAMDVYSDLGVPISCGCGMTATRRGSLYDGGLVREGNEVGGLWYFNQYHAPYSLEFHLESMIPKNGSACPDFEKAKDELAKYDLLCLYMHPHMAVKTRHWDGLNYKKGNLVKWREWVEAPDRDPADTQEYYVRFRAFIRSLKADPRFEITDVERLKASFAPRREISAKDVPAIRAALLRDFSTIRSPSWSVADAFQAATRLLRGEASYAPGKVFGFLERPRGVSEAVEVSAKDLREAAAKIDLSTFLPASIPVGGRAIGPADFLMAALEVLETGAERVTVAPREQLGSFAMVKGLERMKLSGKWSHTPEFKDQYLSERLRLQLWTLRIEETTDMETKAK